MSLKFGFAKQNITPAFPTCLACSQRKDTLFERIHDDLFVRCTVLNHAGHWIVIVSYDLLFHSRELNGFVYNHVRDKQNIKVSDILVNYTHDHNAPSVLGYNDFSASSEYESFLRKKTEACIDMAFSQMETGSMEYGIIPGNWNINRRRKTADGIKLAPNPEGPADGNLYVLKFLSSNGSLKGLIVNYACHPVHYPDTLCLTSEYPGFLCKYLEDTFSGCLPVFIQGAGANARPLGTVENNHFKHRSFKYIEKMAHSMKNAILKNIDSKLFSPIKPQFASTAFCVEIPTGDEGRDYFRKSSFNENLSAHLRRNAEYVCENHDTMKKSFTLHCGLIQLTDNLIIVHMGGEPVCEVKFNILKILAGYDVIFAGYTDSCSYIVTDEMIDEGGYEVDCFLEYIHKGRIKKGIDKIISEGFERYMAQLKS